jgi:exodeoxyribonuclease V alpha subunit
MWELWQLVKFLQQYDIGTVNANRVYEEFGVNALNVIKDNPYILLDVLYGVGFDKIDRIASELGIENNSPYRVSSAIKHGLKMALRNGHTCVNKDSLIDFVVNILGVDINLVTNEMTALTYSNQIYIENDMVFLKEYFEAERQI